MVVEPASLKALHTLEQLVAGTGGVEGAEHSGPGTVAPFGGGR